MEWPRTLTDDKPSNAAPCSKTSKYSSRIPFLIPMQNLTTPYQQEGQHQVIGIIASIVDDLLLAKGRHIATGLQKLLLLTGLY